MLSVGCSYCHSFLLPNNTVHLQLQRYKVQKSAADGLLNCSLLVEDVKPQQIERFMEVNKEQVNWLRFLFFHFITQIYVAYFVRWIPLKDTVQLRKSVCLHTVVQDHNLSLWFLLFVFWRVFLLVSLCLPFLTAVAIMRGYSYSCLTYASFLSAYI